MQSDIRILFNELGFCGDHMKKLYQYGNFLGNALILQTYYDIMNTSFKKAAEVFQPQKRTLFSKKASSANRSSPTEWIRKKRSSCYICDRVQKTHERYLDTFFVMIKDDEFRKLVESSKGFCFRHFADLIEASESKLPGSCFEWFYPTVFSLMENNLDRVKDDLDWFIQKFDYRNANADWKTSSDALPRAMQKIAGIYPADPPHKDK